MIFLRRCLVWRYLPGLYGSPERSTFELVKSNYKDLSLDEDSYISTRNFGKITAKSVDGIPDFCPSKFQLILANLIFLIMCVIVYFFCL